ncbi:MAG: hypothetical protein HXS40_06385 [Theionarchaea archaeon]|nr:hypothetical protein [Theionarchaea archaeon]
MSAQSGKVIESYEAGDIIISSAVSDGKSVVDSRDEFVIGQGKIPLAAVSRVKARFICFQRKVVV